MSNFVIVGAGKGVDKCPSKQNQLSVFRLYNFINPFRRETKCPKPNAPSKSSLRQAQGTASATPTRAVTPCAGLPEGDPPDHTCLICLANHGQCQGRRRGPYRGSTKQNHVVSEAEPSSLDGVSTGSTYQIGNWKSARLRARVYN